MLCELRGWTIFTPGLWSSATWPTREYGPDFTAALGRNFWTLRKFLVPTLRLGHDSEQRLATSMGFLALGTIAATVLLPDGRLVATAVGVPLEIGAVANAGWLRTGSVEISKGLLLGGRERPGPILTSVTLHGEDRVALDEATCLPTAVFADGSPVPPAKTMTRWLERMIEIGANNPKPR